MPSYERHRGSSLMTPITVDSDSTPLSRQLDARYFKMVPPNVDGLVRSDESSRCNGCHIHNVKTVMVEVTATLFLELFFQMGTSHTRHRRLATEASRARFPSRRDGYNLSSDKIVQPRRLRMIPLLRLSVCLAFFIPDSHIPARNTSGSQMLRGIATHRQTHVRDTDNRETERQRHRETETKADRKLSPSR